MVRRAASWDGRWLAEGRLFEQFFALPAPFINVGFEMITTGLVCVDAIVVDLAAFAGQPVGLIHHGVANLLNLVLKLHRGLKGRVKKRLIEFDHLRDDVFLDHLGPPYLMSLVFDKQASVG